MDPAQAADLLDALAEWIRLEDARRGDGPFGEIAHRRSSETAEIEALRRLQLTGSLDAALEAGARAFVREMHHFGPLSFMRDRVDSDADATTGTAAVGNAHGT